MTWARQSKFFDGQNLLLALGLTCYTEFIGRVINGTFGKQGHSASDFDTFLFCYMNRGDNYKRVEREARKLPEYNAAKKSSAIYQLVRCGLAHNYFGKGRVEFFAEHAPREKCGVKVVKQKRKKVLQILAGKIPRRFRRRSENISWGSRQAPSRGGVAAELCGSS